MDEAPGSYETDNATGSLLRYARWTRFDVPQQSGPRVCCWVDRKTGRLVYLPDGLNPNVLSALPGSGQSYVG